MMGVIMEVIMMGVIMMEVKKWETMVLELEIYILEEEIAVNLSVEL